MSDSRHDDRRAGWERQQAAPRPAEDASHGAGHSRSDDPLAELARLIDEDPFADFNRHRETPRQAPDMEEWTVESDFPVDPVPAQEPVDFAEADPVEPGSMEAVPAGAEPGLDDYAASQGYASAEEDEAFAGPEPVGYEEDPDHARLFADLREAHRLGETVQSESEPEPQGRYDYARGDDFEARLFESVDFEQLGEEARQTEAPAAAEERESYSDPVDDGGWDHLPAAAPQDAYEYGDQPSYSGEPEPAGYDEEATYPEDGPHYDDHSYVPYAAEGAENAGASRRGLVVVGSLVGLVILGGAVAFGYRGLVSDAEAPPPVIRADTTPVKIEAEVASAEQEVQSKLVHDRVGGENPDKEARLVSREEPVFDVAGRNSEMRVIEPGQEVGLRGGADATEDEDPVSSAYQPRRVRTVVVRPDGTIVSNPQPVETALASTESEPEIPAAPSVAPRPASPVVESQPEGNPSEIPAASQPASSEPRVVTPAPASATATAETEAGPETPTSETETASGVPIPVPPPQDRPAPSQTASVATQPPARTGGQPMQLVPNRSSSSSGGRTEVAQAPTTQPASPSSTTDAAFPAGTYVVQVASTRNESEARGAASAIKQRYSEQLSGYDPAVERADLGDRGIFYRIAVGPISDQSDASSLCDRLKSAGLDCFVRRN